MSKRKKAAVLGAARNIDVWTGVYRDRYARQRDLDDPHRITGALTPSFVYRTREEAERYTRELVLPLDRASIEIVKLSIPPGVLQNHVRAELVRRGFNV